MWARLILNVVEMSVSHLYFCFRVLDVMFIMNTKIIKCYLIIKFCKRKTGCILGIY